MDEAELAFVATLRDEATSQAKQARRALDSVGGDTRPITTRLDVDAAGARAEVDRVKESFDDVVPAAEDAGEDAGGGFVDGLKGAISGAQGAIAGALGALGIGSLVGDALGLDAAADKLDAALGATPGQAARYGKAAASVYAGAWGSSTEEVNAAIQGVVQNIDGMRGASVEDLTAITGSIFDVATAFDQDLGGTTKAVGQLVRNGLAANATDALDLITAGLQNGADRGGDFIDTFAESSALLAGFGLTGKQSVGAIKQALDAGAPSADTVIGSLEELVGNAGDSVDVFKSLGLNGKQMARDLTSGGPAAGTAIDKLLDSIRAIEDPAKRSRTVVGLFGEEGAATAKALLAVDFSSSAGEIEKVGGAAERMGATLNGNAATNLTSFARQVKQGAVSVLGGEVVPALTTVSTFLVSSFGPAVSTAGGIVKRVTGFLRDHEAVAVTLAVVIGVLAAATAAHAAVLAVAAAGGIAAYLKGLRIVSAVTRVAAAVQWALNAAMLANPFVLIAGLLIALGVALVVAYRKSETFRKIVDGAFRAIRSTVVSVVSAVVGAVSKAWNAVRSWTTKAFAATRNAVSSAWQAIKSAVSSAVNGVRSAVSSAWNTITKLIGTGVRVWRALISAAWNAIKSAVSTAIGAVRSVVSAGFTRVRTAISSAMDTAKSLTSRAWDAIKSFISTRIDNVVTNVGGLLGRIKSALSGAGTALLQVGRDLVSGLISGIGDMAQAAVNKVSEVIGGAKAAAKRILGIASPSKVFRGFGRDTIRGYVKGLTSEGPKVNKTLSRIFGDIRRHYNAKIKDDRRAKDAADRAIRSLRQETAAIKDNERARGRLREELRKTIPEIEKGLRSMADLTTVGTVNDAPLTGGLVVTQLRGRLAALEEFGKDLKRAARKGVDRATLEAIAAQGVEAGGAMANALANADAAQLAAITRAQRKIRQAAGSIGDGFAKGVAQDLRPIEKAGRQLADALVKALRKRLGIRSPSRVMAEDGRNTVRGLTAGLLEETRHAEIAAEVMAARVAAAAVPSLPDLGRLAADVSAVRPGSFGVTSTEVVTIRHEIVSPDRSVSDLTAEQVADLIARNPQAARVLETALVRQRRRRESTSLSSTR